MLIFIRALSGGVTPLTVHPYENVLSVKFRLLQLKGIAVSQQHLLYDGIELPDATVLALAKISHGSLLRLVIKMNAAPLNRLVANSSVATTVGNLNTNQKLSTSICPVPIPVGTPTPYWSSTIELPFVSGSALEQHPQRKRSYIPVNSHSGHYDADCRTETDNAEDEVSQLAEFLGYAIDGSAEFQSSGNDGLDPIPHELEDEYFVDPHQYSMGSTPPISNFTQPVFHLLPVNGALIPVLSYVQCTRDPWQISTPVTENRVSSSPSYTNHQQDSTLEESCAQIYFGNNDCSTETSYGDTNVIHPSELNTNKDQRAVFSSTQPNRLPVPDSLPSELTPPSRDAPTHRPSSELLTPELMTPVLFRLQNHSDLPTNSLNRPSAYAGTLNYSACSVQNEHYFSSTQIPVSIPEPTRSQCFKETLERSNTSTSQSSPQHTRSSSEKRCSVCRKRTRLTTGFTCWCGRWFCIKHHHPEDHNCDFDFKTKPTDP